jgi:hypothetical protein
VAGRRATPIAVAAHCQPGPEGSFLRGLASGPNCIPLGATRLRRRSHAGLGTREDVLHFDIPVPAARGGR